MWTKGIHNVADFHVENTEFLGSSSHRPVVFSIQLNSDVECQNIPLKKVYKLENLSDKDLVKNMNESIKIVCENITEKIKNHITIFTTSNNSRQVMIQEAKQINNETEKEFNLLIEQAMENFCGTRFIPKFKIHTTENTKVTMLQKKLNAIHKLQKKGNWEFFDGEKIKVLNEMEKERELTRRQAFDSFASSLANKKKSEQQKFLKRVIKLRLGNKEGGLNNDKASMQKASNYFSSLFKNDNSKGMKFTHNWELSSSELAEVVDEIFNSELINNLIKYSPKRKAPGNSGISNEILIATVDVISPLIHEWFKFCLITGTIPKGWTDTIIIPIFKKGDKALIENYRPISLLENLRKLFERCLEIFIKSKMERLEIQQGGFREGRSTLDQILCLDNIMRVHKKQFKKFPIVSYLDIKAAYDSVDRSILFDDCIEKGIHPIVVEMLKQLFEFNKAKVSINGNTTQSFRMKAGVQQGSILSPLLYSIFIDKVVKELQKGPGIEMENGTKINNLLYADDIAIISKTAKDMNNLLSIAQRVVRERNFTFNNQKCVYTAEREVILKLGSESIEKVGSFNYLGVQFNYKGMDSHGHLLSIKCKMEKKINFFTIIGMNKNGYRPLTKSLLYKSFIRSVMEYGIAILRITKKSLAILNSIQNMALSKMFSVNRKTSIQTLQMISGILPMANRERILKLKWLNRYNNLEDDELMLLPKIENFVIKNGLMARNEEIYIQINDLLPREEKDIKTIIREYTNRVFEDSKQNIKIFAETPLKELKNKEIYKFVCGKFGEKLDIHTIVLFLLNKFPGKPVKCKKCNEVVSKNHLITCNINSWTALIETIRANKRIRNIIDENQELLDTPSLWPYLLVKLIVRCAARKDKEMIIKEIAHLIRSSMKICVAFQ